MAVSYKENTKIYCKILRNASHHNGDIWHCPRKDIKHIQEDLIYVIFVEVNVLREELLINEGKRGEENY